MKIFNMLIILWLIIFSYTAKGNENNIKIFLSDVKTLHANFTQTIINEQGIELEKSGGEVFLMRPDKFRWNYTHPYQQTIVTDGFLLWFYDVDIEQISVRDISTARSSMPLAVLSHNKAIEQHFVIEDMKDIEQSKWVKLIPNDTDTQYENIRFGFEQGNLIMIVILDKFDQVTRIDLSETIINEYIDPSIFDFNPPDGVDVIGNLDREL